MSKITVLFASFVALSVSAFAVDGVTLINQATIVAGGGFPYAISQPGSYRLSGNLVVPTTVATGISITGPNVALDLNGFTISCPGCSIPIGIDSTGTGTRIFNGTITGFPYIAVDFESTGASVDHMNFLTNGESIVSNNDLSVSDSAFMQNSGDGIAVNDNSAHSTSLLVANSKFVHNLTFGINAPSTYAAMITGCVFLNNGNAAHAGGTSGGVTIYSGTVTASSFTSSYTPIFSNGQVLISQNSFYGAVLPLGSGIVSTGNNACSTFSKFC